MTQRTVSRYVVKELRICSRIRNCQHDNDANNQMPIAIQLAADVAAVTCRVGHTHSCPGPVASLSHSRNSATGQRRSRPEGARPPHTRRQAGFFRHVVRECSLQGFLPGKGLHPGRAHGARADQSGHQTTGRPALYRVVQGTNEDTARQRRPSYS